MNENQQGVQLIESEEDKKKKAAAQAQPGSAFAGGTTSPVGAPSAAPSAGQQARAAQQAGPTKGTGFTGVGRYLQANVGSRLGEQVAGRVAQTGQQAQTRLGQAVGQFGQQLGQQQQQLTAQQQAAQGALQRIAGKPSEAPQKGKKGEFYLSPEQRFKTSLPPMSAGLQTKFDEYEKNLKTIGDYPEPEVGADGIFRNTRWKFAKDQDEANKAFLASLTPEERAEYDSRQYKPKEFVKDYTPIGERIDGIDRSQISAGLTKYAVPNLIEKVSGESLPVDLTPSQEEVAAYQAIAGGQFQAPTGLEDASGIRSQAQLASELAKGTTTAQGRMGLLRQIVGRGTEQYGKGKSALDALILGQAGGQLAAARRGVSGLERRLGMEERLAGEQARQFGAEVERAKTGLAGEVTGVESPITGNISKRLEEFKTQRPQFLKDLETAIDKGELTEEQAVALGIGEGGLATSGITKQELKNLITSGISPSDITAQAISSPEQAAKLNALYRLMGKDQFATPEQLQKVGSLKDIKQDIRFDLEKAKEAGAIVRTLPEAKTDFEAAKANVLKQVQGFINSPVTGLTIDEQGNPTKESAERSMNYFRSIQNLERDAAGPISNERRARWKEIADSMEAYLKSQDVLYGQPIRVLRGPMGTKFGATPAISPTGTKK